LIEIFSVKRLMTRQHSRFSVRSFYSKPRSRLFGFVNFSGLCRQQTVLAFTFATWLPLALGCLFISGLGMLTAFATMTGTVQRLVDDRFRGRVMSIYLMVLLGLMPFGNLLMGLLSEHFSTSVALRTGAIVTLAATIFLFMSRKEITKAWQEYRAEES
jgi:MFS family permease